MNENQAERRVFQKYVPSTAVDYCLDLFNQYGFLFKITRSRKTKLGDYRFLTKEKRHVITVNYDLNRYQFLVTYIHEVAHLVTFESYQDKVLPHGKEWKNNFRMLMEPVNHAAVFPYNLLSVINSYLKNPRASSCADPTLFKALRSYDEVDDGRKMLAELLPGDVFEFNNRLFQKELKKRTRSLCIELKSGKQYLIPEVATVHQRLRDNLDKN